MFVYPGVDGRIILRCNNNNKLPPGDNPVAVVILLQKWDERYGLD